LGQQRDAQHDQDGERRGPPVAAHLEPAGGTGLVPEVANGRTERADRLAGAGAGAVARNKNMQK
jgi:hypothetical protein